MTVAWAQDEPQGDDDASSAEPQPVVEGGSEEEPAPSAEDIAMAQRIHELLDRAEAQAMDDIATTEQKAEEENEPTLTKYRNT